jgi:hypothetical protein
MFVTALYKIYVVWTFCCTVVVLDLQSSTLREVSACPRSPKVVLFRQAKFLLETLSDDNHISHYIILRRVLLPPRPDDNQIMISSHAGCLFFRDLMTITS